MYFGEYLELSQLVPIFLDPDNDPGDDLHADTDTDANSDNNDEDVPNLGLM